MGNKVARALTSDGCLLGVALLCCAVASYAQLIKIIGLIAADVSSTDQMERTQIAAESGRVEHLTDVAAYTLIVMLVAGAAALVALVVSPSKKPRTAMSARVLTLLFCLVGGFFEIVFWTQTNARPIRFYWFVDIGPIAVAAVAAAVALSRQRPPPSPV